MAIPDEKYIVDKISSIPEYKELFEKAFPEKMGRIKFEQITMSISSFQRTFRTSDRFDDFQRGRYKSLTLVLYLAEILFRKLESKRIIKTQKTKGVLTLQENKKICMCLKSHPLEILHLPPPIFMTGVKPLSI